MRETVLKNGNRLYKNGKNGLLCFKITKTLSLVIIQKMKLCLCMTKLLLDSHKFIVLY